MTSVYKALAQAAISQGDVELPDGKTYTVRSLSVAEMLRMQDLADASEQDTVVLPFYITVAARATGASPDVIGMLTPAALVYLVQMAQHGVDAIAKAIAATEAPASGNAAAAAVTPKRSTSRKRR